MSQPATSRLDRAKLLALKAAGRRFAMLTAYDYPTARLAQAAGVHSLLVGDSMGAVLLGHEHTRDVPLELMLILGQAVRRGAPDVYLVGDLPYAAISAGPGAILSAAQQFAERVQCQAVKLEAERAHAPVVRELARRGFDVMVHLGLRPQQVLSPDGYRAQAREPESIAALVRDAAELVDAGAASVLLEAVPAEASQAVRERLPSTLLIGCGAGPACDGHVVVTQDMLGLGHVRPPRFVPRLADLNDAIGAAMRRYVEDVVAGRYPAPEHTYPLRRAPAAEQAP